MVKDKEKPVEPAPDAESAKETKKKRKQAEEKPEKIKKVKAEIVKEPGKGRYGKNNNLTSIGDRATDVQRQIQSAGGKARAEKLRRQKELREFTRDFLFQQAVPALQNNMKILGVVPDEMTNLSAMVVRLFSKAVNNGDLNAARTIIEWAGMAPLQQERENEAIAKMSQVMQLAAGTNEAQEEADDVIFYIPDNGRNVGSQNNMVVVETKTQND